MGESCKTRALVLFRRPVGEHDEIVGLFTPRQGRLDAAVRGSKKLNSAWVGKIEPFAELEVWLAPGRQLGYLTQAEMLHSFSGVRQTYPRLCWGSYFLELWAALTLAAESGENAAAYDLLRQTLSVLEEAERFRLAGCWCEWNLLRLLGQQPYVSACVLCGSSSLAGYAYSDGGAVCADCLSRSSQAVFLPRRMLLMLQHLPRLTPERAVAASADPEEMRFLEEIVWRHWCACGLPRVRARKLLEKLD